MVARKFKAEKGANGVLPGLYACDICRIEKLPNGTWKAQVPMRRIGKSRYREFLPLERGGEWMNAGVYRVMAGALAAAERLESGVFVWQPASADEFGSIPGQLVEFKDAADEIREMQ